MNHSLEDTSVIVRNCQPPCVLLIVMASDSSRTFEEITETLYESYIGAAPRMNGASLNSWGASTDCLAVLDQDHEVTSSGSRASTNE